MSDEILKKLFQILKEIKPVIKIIDKNSDLTKDLGMDSLDTISFFFEVEKAFNIKMSESDIAENKLLNIDKLIKYIGKRVDNI